MGEQDVVIVETLPRDGLPYIKGITVQEKVTFINLLAETGIKRIDCVSFTHPRIIPEYADAEQVIKGIRKKPDIIYSGVVPNEIGCRRAVVTAIDEVELLISVSDYFNQVNVGRTLHETLNKAPTYFQMAKEMGKSVRCYVFAPFGCPYTGEVPIEDVLKLLMKLSYMGARELSLVDVTGMANPRQVKFILKEILNLKLPSKLAVHFHNTRNSAVANYIAAYDAGVRIFDTSISGMSKEAYGVTQLDIDYWNLPTEDLVHLLEEMGINTGIDIDMLLKCVENAEKLAGKALPGHLLRAEPLRGRRASRAKKKNNNHKIL